VIAICGDVMHSRVARSNILLLNTMGARVRVVAPSTLLPRGIERMGVEVARDMREGLNGADIVMMLRLQRERMNGSFVPSSQEYFHYFGLDQKKLAYAKPDALVMHPGADEPRRRDRLDRGRRRAIADPRTGGNGSGGADGGARSARPQPAERVRSC
jgi:aspartate carbamoyltransferase catalytic subunit